MASKFSGRPRRGIALVLMVMMMSVFILAAAFSTDFGRMYLIKGQLQTAADAAALAAIQSQSLGIGASSKDTGKVYVYGHPVAGRAHIDTSTTDVIPGNWDMATHVFTPDPDVLWGLGAMSNGMIRDAIKVVTRHTAPFTFGRLLGWTQRTITDTAVAVWGSVTSSTCVRPWAIPYQKLLDKLYDSGTVDVSHVLTPQNIADLAAMTDSTDPVVLKIPQGQNEDYTGPSQFYAIRIPAAEYADGTPGPTSTGGADYRSEVAAQTCAQLKALFNVDPTVHVGDWLDPENGNMVGPTHQGISGQGQTPGICGTSDTCTGVKIIAALWDTYGASPGGVCGAAANAGCYHVKYLAEFTLSGWDNAQKAVTGHFNLLNLPADGAGGFTAGGSTSAVLAKALVK